MKRALVKAIALVSRVPQSDAPSVMRTIRVVSAVVALAVIACIIVMVEGGGNDRAAKNRNDSIDVAMSPDAVARHSLSRRTEIEKIARREHRSIEDVERQIVREIQKGREDIKRAMGGYDPGVHVVAGNDDTKIDPDAVKEIPDGALVDLDKIAKSPNLRPSAGLRQDKSLYIDAEDLGFAGLTGDKMVGYTVSGTYLNGKDYARTESLRKLESTPTGKTGWTGLSRVYSGYEGLGDVIVDDLDIVAGRQTLLVPGNTLNVKVGAYPATLARLKTPDGVTMSDVNWIDDKGRSRSLKIRQVDDRSVAILMGLAEKLAR